MRGDLILIGLGILLGTFSTIGYQKVFGPSTYDECLMATAKTWASQEFYVAERICSKKFPFIKEKTAQ